MTKQQKEKAAFLKQYAVAANAAVLEKIWEAKQSQATFLNLNGEKSLTDLSPLKDLSKLQTLRISNTQVRDLSPLKGLENLQMLYVNYTQVSDLSPLKALANLKRLDVANTQVSDLTPLKALVNLQILWIANTQVSDLTPLKALVNLQSLDVRNTQVSDLSPLKGLIKKGIEVKWKDYDGTNDGIFIKDTPLINPPVEIAKQGNEAILRYWQEQERSGTIQLNEARLLIVGQGGAGKTTLRKKLMDKGAAMPEAADTTRGIEIEVLNFKNTEGGDFGLHIWDFGGQEIQHYAHQFFLSDAVVYALVHSEREENDQMSYWLNIIQQLGKNSPVVIVQNEKFGHSKDLHNLAAIRESFPNVEKPIKVDLSQADTPQYRPFKELEAKLQHLACQLPHIGTTYLRSFDGVRTALNGLARTEHSISWDTFEGLCRKEGITDTALMRDYAHYFHQLGIALWFEDDELLDQLVFLRPKWIIDTLFELLYDGLALRKQARISVKDVKAIWRSDDYRGMHGHLLRLMKNFEMCYELLEDTPQYIVPQLLPADRATYVRQADATKVVFQYKFLPKGFLTRLTCRLHTRIADDNVWSNAVLFKNPNAAATVFAKEVYAQNALELIAEGSGKRQLLNDVIQTLKDINNGSKFKHLPVKILIDCPCPHCQKATITHQFEYDDLERKLLKGRRHAECQKSDELVLIKDILREVNPFSFSQIKDYIRNGRAEDALNLLRGRYDERHEVIGLTFQMSKFNLDKIEGLHTREDERVEYNRLSGQLLGLLKVLAEED
jgi:internalin A